MPVCTFAGHSDTIDSKELRNKLYTICKNSIELHHITEFMVGNYGNFDRIASGVINLLKKEYPNIILSLVIPYLTSKINNNKNWYYSNYDDIIIADIPHNTPIKYYIIESNRYMVNKSDVIICSINHKWGGAFKTYDYARKNNKIIYNIQ